MGLSMLDYVVTPKRALAKFGWDLLTKPQGEHATCSACDRAVLKCPECHTINSDETWPVVCTGCRKELAHK